VYHYALMRFFVFQNSESAISWPRKPERNF